MVLAAPISPLSAPLQAQLNRLRQLNTQNIQTHWQLCDQDISLAQVFDAKQNAPHHWSRTALNNRQHIAWARGLNVIWLYQTITVPPSLAGYPLSGLNLKLALTWWADDAQIYVDGDLVQSGDLFECFTRICLSPCVEISQTFRVAIRLVSPGHDDGALARPHLVYEHPPSHPTPEPSFVADELTVLATLEPDSRGEIETAITQLDWNSLSHSEALNQEVIPNPALDLWQTLSADATKLTPATIHPFQQSLSQLRRGLKSFSPKIKTRTIQCVGHAHLDMAWLWPISDTWNAAERTFKSILNLQKDFPELTYTHSSPALFEWIEHNRPKLFKSIQHIVKEGSWSIDAGLWIEPEFNIICGEAIARHILYGQRYCQEKFGHISTVAWLPDSFGFCWQLPQLLTQGGIETFATLKLSWNDTTEFPHQLFWWQSPDGSQILSLMLPAIGTDIDPIKMVNQAAKWETNTDIPNSIWLPGMGDHGGGPTRDMLEKARRWQTSPFFPELGFTSPEKYIKALPTISSNSKDSATAETDQSSLPIWNNELYLELHRGCYTTHADQKQSNRQGEELLYQAELFASVAKLIVNKPYPRNDIDTAWKTLLFNQFHDILPGTSIPAVFVEADRGWQQVISIGKRVLEESLCAIASSIHLPESPHTEATPIIVFNALSWARNATISMQAPDHASSNTPRKWIVCDTEQTLIPCQNTALVSDEQSQQNILFSATIPAVGYRCFWLYPTEEKFSFTQPSTVLLSNHILENQFIRVTIDNKTGHIISLIEKSTNKETFSSPANQLQAFRDESGYWDAWNIAPDYADHPLSAPVLSSVELIESGIVCQRLRTVYQLNNSNISQDYVLEADSPFLKVESTISWQETKTLLKVNFPTTVEAKHITYEIPFGAITRTTLPQNRAEEAKWEVPALRWADISESCFGMSILTNAKHGFDAGPNYLRLTLLKSSIWPDPLSDKGIHQFTYAIYPHDQGWQTAKTVRMARELNSQPILHNPTVKTTKEGDKKGDRSFLEIHNKNLILSTFKLAENSHTDFVLRCYEAHGEQSQLEITSTLNLSNILEARRTDLLEQPSDTEQTQAAIKPWQIASYRFRSTT
ncbi:MAG: alpha-mannosidase [Phormidesmis sp.]